ncbi:RHS repeat-associated core domain-containing protein [Leifsonia sp. ZF2019]|uniref:RHS repeat-associated core domain-containing protein n=1 Tax=Leifsonia sp. ZF2019 TaxID=2781978 RepID=UPI001CBE0AF1|nr:RHS repeat-associated core domain-containing protein [Leifsonia sp. ZF2019]UAJ79320.1 RHS repeat-associated core domain-containing protein [Leifsonia sp. ZF2019]
MRATRMRGRLVTRLAGARVGMAVLASVAAVALTLVGTVTPAEASPAELARRTAAATLAEVRAAAAVQDARVKAETEAPAPQATGSIEPGKTSTIDADRLGASVTFSGNKVESKLDVEVGGAPANALRAARSEQPSGGTPVSDPVEITAKDADGKQVTQFPAKAVNTRGGGEKGPVVSDVVPGVALELKPDLDLVTSNNLDPATLQIYTRENPGEPWTVLPSYYDAEAGVVKGVSSHLSQFVVIGIPFPVPDRPVIVLDPDNDEGHVTTPAPPVTELPYNIQLAQLVRDRLQNLCFATVHITNEDPANVMVPREYRAGQMAAWNPSLSLGIGFNTWEGVAWGGEHPEQGGSQVYSRGGASDNAVSDSLVGNLPTYTGRPAKNMGNNGNFPGDEFAGVPNAFTHLEALYLDNNYDRAYIDNGGMPPLADGVFTGLGKYLETHGFDCTDPVTGGWPTPPSAADFARWRMLGLQNYLTYGGEPFAFSTGNLFEKEELFSLPGTGGSSTDLTLYYNSQDGRLSRVGAGWSFGMGARAQRFIDGSVMVVRGDGASFVFTGDGNGGYRTSDAGVHQTLTEAGGGRLKLTDVSGESWVFDASNIDGIGNLIQHTDAEGRTTTLTYGAPADPETTQFYPLASITDSAGQTIAVDSDALGRVTSFTRPGGDRWSLSYDGAGNLTTITLPDGRTKQFTYDDKHQLLTGTDATGATYLKNQYDDQGRVVKQWDVEGNLRTLDYSVAGQTTYTDNLGRTSVYAFDDRFRITKVTHPDGTTAAFSYDADNNILSSTDENGKKTTYGYDAAGNLTTETAPDGIVTKYTYTPTGLVATKTDTGGPLVAASTGNAPRGSLRTWSYDYDGAGHLVATHQPDGTTITNEYDAAGNVVKTTQPSGAATTFAYDAAGNLTASTDAIGRTSTYAYDAAGRMTAQTDLGGHTTSYAWDSGDRLVTATDATGAAFGHGWEPNDHLASLTDPTGAVTRYSWDAMFHLTDSTSPGGGVTRYGYTAEDALSSQTDPLGATTTRTTDDRDRVITTVDPTGGEWRYSYDGVGNLLSSTSPSGAKTTFTYDDAGHLLTQKDPTGGTTTSVYDSVGRLVRQTDPDGVVSKYEYDAMDRVVRVIDGLGKRTDLSYDVDGNLTGVVDRQGNPWAFTYDAAGQLLTAKSPLGAVTTYGYDADGGLATVTDPLGRTTTNTYDALDRLVSTTDPVGRTTSYAYDANGRTTSVTDPNGHTTSFAYDADGNQTSTTDATGAVTSYGWDAAGNQTSATDANGHVTRYAYDPAGQLVRVTEGYREGAAASADVNVVSKYGYDADGALTSVTDPNGHRTTYTVDAAGRTTKEVDPVGTTTAWSYTAAGRLASLVNGNGARTTYAYDGRGDLSRQNQAGAVATYEYSANQQLIAMTDPTGTSGWTYDKDGRTTAQLDQQGGRLKTAYDKAGQVTSMTLPTGQKLDYTYDAAGEVTSQSSPWGALTYSWDPAGNLTDLVRSNGVATSYSYDAVNRVVDVLHTTPEAATPASPSPSATPVAFAAGDAQSDKCVTVAGYLSARSAPAAGENGMCKHANTYLNGRALPMPENPVADGGALRYQYGYDADGNVTKATRTITPAAPVAAVTDGAGQPSSPVPGVPSAVTPPTKAKVTSTSYGYDGVDRLASSTVSSGEKNTYAYDPAGNRIGWTRTGAADGNFSLSAVFNDANQLTRSNTSGAGRGVSGGVASYSYDRAGNRVSQSVAGVGSSLSYNASGQATQVSRDGRSTSYAYDGLGRQASSTDQTKYGSVTTANVFDGTSLVQSVSSTQGTTTVVRDAAGALAEHVTASGEATWDLLDGLGSTIAGVTGGSVTQLVSYDDWGGQAFETDGWDAPVGYTGHVQDATQGLMHTFARSYDVGTGTWTSPDTWRGLLVQPKSLARYQYAWNNPTTFWDPDGHRCASRAGASDALPLGCGAPPHQAWENVQMPPDSTTTSTPSGPSGPSVSGPNDQNDLPSTHDCPAGKVRYISPYVSPQCVDAKNLKDSEERARLWLECNNLCGDAWLAFVNVVLDGIGVVPGLVLCGASLPVGGGACVDLDPQDVASFIGSLYDWQDAEYALWADQLKRWGL